MGACSELSCWYADFFEDSGKTSINEITYEDVIDYYHSDFVSGK
jgi:hypothetical protein